MGTYELVTDGALTGKRSQFKDSPPVLHANKKMVWFPVTIDPNPKYNADTHRLVSDTVLEGSLVRDTRTKVALSSKELGDRRDGKDEGKLKASTNRIHIVIIKELAARGTAVTPEFKTLLDRLNG